MASTNLNAQSNTQIREYFDALCNEKLSDILFEPSTLKTLIDVYVNQEHLDWKMVEELDKAIRYLCFRVGLIFEHYGYFDEDDIPDLFNYGDYGYVYEIMLTCMYAARKKYLDIMLRDLAVDRELSTDNERYYVKLSHFNQKLVGSDLTKNFMDFTETNSGQPFARMKKGNRHWKIEFPNFCPSVEYTKYTKAAYEEVAHILSIAFSCKATVEVLEP